MPAAAARAAEDGAARRKELARLSLALAAGEAERLAAGRGSGPVRAVVVPPAAGRRRVRQGGRVSRSPSAGASRSLGAVEDGRAHLAFARPKGAGPHLGELVRVAAAALDGKGGGAPDLAQGSGPDAARLEAALADAEAALAAIKV